MTMNSASIMAEPLIFRLATDASSIPLKIFDLNLEKGEDDPNG